ncbi:MAG TPA: hypothetical protein O0Y00_01950, partial [Methanocorpusculum sp.]|nr:hypothetical protein [Methanocorpusculum sp.]
MKNTKIMAVLVVLLAAMLFVGAASAAATNGGTYFVNQKVNFTGTLYLLSGDQNEVVLDSFSIKAGERILPGFIGTNTGVWYDNTTKATSDKYYSIWYPEITLMGELSWENSGAATSSGDTINGKTINKDTNVSFIIVAPKLGGVNVSVNEKDATKEENLNTNATVKIVFTTPANGKTTMFGGEDFTEIKLNATQVYANDAVVSPGDNAIAGTWTAQAEFDSPQSFADYAEKSNSISFTVQSTSVSITAAKDSVIRSNPFTVTIQGKSLTPYAVYLETPSASDVNPTLQDDQIGFQKGYDFTDGKYKVAAGEITYDGSDVIGGIFNTDASGQRIVQFNTDADTEDKTYTVKVSALKGNAFDTATYDKVKVKVEKGAVTITASGDGQYYIGQEITLSGTNTDSNDVFLFITGPNLAADGINLKMVEQKKDEASYAYMNNQPVSVNTDYTWEYKWDTSKCGLDTGAYTIYATSMLTNGKSSADKNIT